MDRNDELRVIVKRVLHGIALMTPSEGDVRTELVCDDAIGHYHLGGVGWKGQQRVDNIILHADVQDEKVWFQYNGTDLRVADMLMDAGISREKIVLAFHPTCASIQILPLHRNQLSNADRFCGQYLMPQVAT